MDPMTLLAFAVVALIAIATPGPTVLLALANGSRFGLRRSVAGMLGAVASDVVLVAAVALGLGALLAASEFWFSVVKWVGAAYLAWLGFKMLTAKPGAKPVLNIEPRHYFKQAGLITLLNPKAIVFYMAFFPLFVDPARHQGMLTFGVMAATIAALTFAYGLIVVLLTHRLAERMRANPRISRTLEKLAGVFLVGFGIKLAISK